MLKLFLLALLASGPSLAADETKPHPHQGKSEKFTNPKPTKLSKAEIATIKKGDAVRRQIQNDSGGRGIAIMDVKASPDKIWKTIADYKAYPNWIDKLDKTSVYGGSPATGQKVKFELSVFGMDVVYFIDHSFHQSRRVHDLDPGLLSRERSRRLHRILAGIPLPRHPGSDTGRVHRGHAPQGLGSWLRREHAREEGADDGHLVGQEASRVVDIADSTT